MRDVIAPGWLPRMNEALYAELEAGMRASGAYLADSMERKRLERAESVDRCARVTEYIRRVAK